MSRHKWLRWAGVAVVALAVPTAAEWTNRYPKIANVSHHVYLEGFNLPTFATSPTDPAPSPDGRQVAFAARGWLWVMDVGTRQARPLTRDGGVDSRPAWSPDGRQIAFVRDSSRDLAIWTVAVASGQARVLVDTPAMDMDPVFAPDGRSVFYASAEAGDLDIWRIDLANNRRTRLTEARGQELNPQPIAGGLAFIAKPSGASDTVATLDFASGKTTVIRREGLAPQMRLAAAPDGRSLAFTPFQGGDRTALLLTATTGGETIRLATDARYPLTPAWGGDDWLWYVEPGRDERFLLKRVRATGGASQDMTPRGWNGGEPLARVTVRTRVGGKPSAARIAVADVRGHPAAPATGISYFDGQHGRIFFHSAGVTTVEVPAGEIGITASRGFDGAATVRRVVRAGEAVTIDLDLPATGFDAAARGWFAADLHSHLNYGGPFQLEPDDLVTAMRAEGLDVATPQLANLQTTLVDERWWGANRTTAPLIRFSQEVRSHFLGHVAVLGADRLHDPWFFGPGYPVYGQIDLSNASPLRFARAHGGMNVYVHPVSGRDPFPAGATAAGLPLELVPDALAGDVDTLEIACLWSDELGTAQAWYRLLNLGLPIMPSGGSDTMHNFHRTMAIGAARIYARAARPLTVAGYLAAVKAGRSFVTTGPMLEFAVAGQGPGGIVARGGRLPFTLEAWSASGAEQVEVLVNGRVAWSGGALAGHRRYSGTIEVPAGGWVAARVHGGTTAWPSQDSYPFAHTAPVWIGRRGSSDPAAVRAAAADLSRWLDVADAQLARGYPGAAGGGIKARFATARARLTGAAQSGVLSAAQP
ncbi:LpqB family beta-propeller domain-containing protein [Sphingomonas sp.]|jgi:TolB protein|uniref:LpqB family beta-propeller domain-containing protein n=1 Tax=Sphingomonas sp. TaxID=28214 RepID=UPI002D7F12B9|nr:LpqB family beta-propeller domain-containing protein [Sphingomonas sp.]HEU0043273.1 LpqB family beta-propeller domain-containing protein [Sphingomonas sp.]